MQLIKSSELQSIISELRKKDIKNFQTNYFLNELDDEVQYLQNNGAVVFMQPDRDIYRLFFAFINIADFEALLLQLPTDIKISLEILTKKEIDKDLYNCIDKYLPYYTTFLRSRCNIENLRVLSKTNQNDILFAKLEDADFIEEALNNSFEHFSSHLPAKKELVELIKNKHVIITKQNNKIDTLIIYKVNQNNINFDQWLSLNKNGTKIIDIFYNYIKTCTNYKQIYNWVDIDNNPRVQNFHKFYGYKPDGLKDLYFINNSLKNSIK